MILHLNRDRQAHTLHLVHKTRKLISMKTRDSLPIIGLTLDHEPPGGYSKYPWYAIRENYFRAVVASGGLPIALPHEPNKAIEYVKLIDGLIVTGGNFDINPHIFGALSKHHTVKTKDRRTDFELALTKHAHLLDLPTLGICGGEQLINVALGGSLIQHIPDTITHSLEHEQKTPRHLAGHTINIERSSLLYSITKKLEMNVNSAHHQAVEKPAATLKVNAFAPDGVIEGIEDPSKNWFIGVQWHPEFEIDSGDSSIFKSFITASKINSKVL